MNKKKSKEIGGSNPETSRGEKKTFYGFIKVKIYIF